VIVPSVKQLSNMMHPVRDSWTPVRRSEAPPSARSLLLTMLGEFVLPDGGSVWTGSALECLSLLGVEEAAARQALARTSARGLLSTERVGRKARWSLTDRARAVLTEGAARIYGHGIDHPEWDGRWLLVLTTVPEANRHLRSQLRDRMTWAGLGPIGPGAWVTPWAQRETEIRAALGELDLTAGALSWVGWPGALGEVEARVEEIWDLDAIASDYEAFKGAAESEDPSTAEEAFVSLVRLVQDWRHFPAADPGLPEALLPPDWPAREAADLFRDRRRRWSAQAWRYWRDATSRHS
jgi:phenylacetic acid degradation operon negative regulatory protein